MRYLKHAYDLSDEAVCERWLENPYWRRRFPEKAIAYPTDSRLLEVARKKLVLLAKRHGIALRQSYARQGPALSRKAGRYAHARQFKRMRRVLRRQRTVLGRVQRKLDQVNTGVRERIAVWLERAQQVHAQRPKDKQKLYALHAPEVECIGKGKARQAYEFGVKVGIAVTACKGLVVGARSFRATPEDCRLRRCRRKSTQGHALQVLGLRRRLQPALADALDRVFARLDPGNGMGILERRSPIIAGDWCLVLLVLGAWCLKGVFQGRLVIAMVV